MPGCFGFASSQSTSPFLDPAGEGTWIAWPAAEAPRFGDCHFGFVLETTSVDHIYFRLSLSAHSFFNMPTLALFATSMAKNREILNVTKVAYPAIVLGVFIVVFIIHGILTAPDDGDKLQLHPARGPGGRPLPQRRVSARKLKEAAKVKDFSPSAKLTFRVMSAGVLISFLVDAVILILQVIIYRKEEWWPGQSAVVSFH